MSKYINANELKLILNREHLNYSQMIEKKFVLNAIDKMPSADVVEVKYGHWELQEADELWLDCEWICSECKGRNDSYNKTNFCPNCGADMRERKETK